MPEVVDAVVVGAGVNGLSLAFHLARRGAGRIVVLDRGRIGAGATARSGGIVRTHYADEAEIRLAREGLRWYQNWAELVGGDCGFQAVGLMVIVAPERVPQLEQTLAAQRSLGIDGALLSAEEAYAIDPALRLPESVTHVGYEPGAGGADPNLTVRALTRALARCGVSVREEVAVTDVVRVGSRVTGVTTEQGFIAAGAVVVAAGAWANQLLLPLGLDLGLRPARARVATFQAPPARPWPHPVYLDNVRGSWYRPTAGATTLVGVESAVGRHPPLDGGNSGVDSDIDSGIDDDFVGTCARTVAERFPVMRGAAFRGAWSGLFMESPDGRPVIGPMAPYDGLFAIAGDSGTSFKTAPAIGLGLAELMLDGRARTVDLAPFGAERFAVGTGRTPAAGYTAEQATVSR